MINNLNSENHEDANYNQWLVAEIQESINDPRESISNEEVNARMDARIAKIKEKNL